jgi:hypothetical protein
MKIKMKLSVLAVTLMAMSSSWSAVTEQEAKALNSTLTAIGAEKKGNAAGTIPAYTGGLKRDTEIDPLLNPFPNDKPLFVITNKNVDQYKENLSEGQLALFAKYPDTYKMPIYPSRRTAVYPDNIKNKALKNATKTQLIEGGNGLIDFDESIPFAMPKSGIEIVWNHISRFRGGAVERNRALIAVQESGSFNSVHVRATQVFPQYLADGYNEKDDSNVLFYFDSRVKAPARLTGNVLLVHETINQVRQPRLAWTYNAGQRRVRRAPQVAYDAPSQGSDGLMTTDQVDMFNGAPDKYDWNLIGKTELYIPYNAYLLADTSKKYDEIIMSGHMRPKLSRYELHRVWKVEATLKSDERHIYGKRTFYVDEDTWQVAIADHYDGRGVLWRVAEGHMLQFTNVNVPWYAALANYDLLSGQGMLELSNQEKDAFKYNIERKHSDYTASSLRRSGTR